MFNSKIGLLITILLMSIFLFFIFIPSVPNNGYFKDEKVKLVIQEAFEPNFVDKIIEWIGSTNKDEKFYKILTLGQNSMELLKHSTADKFIPYNISQYGNVPCTYFFINEFNTIKYIGKAKNCTQRLRHHYRGNPGGNKQVFINRENLKLFVAKSNTIKEAECAEAIAIKIAKPTFNTRIESIKKACGK